VSEGKVVESKLFTALSRILPIDGLCKEMESAGLRVLGRHEVTSEFQIQASFAVIPKIYLLEAGR
jgi:hypothetical protein